MSMDIWRKSTPCLVVRVGNIVSCNRFLASYHTNPGHFAASFQLTRYLSFLAISGAEAQVGTRLKKELRFIPERSANSKIIKDCELRSHTKIGAETGICAAGRGGIRRRTDSYNKPRSAKETTIELPITRWSSTRTSMVCKAMRNLLVMAMSAWLGSATPDG